MSKSQAGDKTPKSIRSSQDDAHSASYLNYLKHREDQRTRKVYAVCGTIAFGFACITAGVISNSWSKLDWRVQMLLVLVPIVPAVFTFLMWRRFSGLLQQIAEKSDRFFGDGR